MTHRKRDHGALPIRPLCARAGGDESCTAKKPNPVPAEVSKHERASAATGANKSPCFRRVAPRVMQGAVAPNARAVFPQHNARSATLDALLTRMTQCQPASRV
jgi:hypothetical protein